MFAWFCLVIVLLGRSHAGKRKGGKRKRDTIFFLLYFRPRPVKISFSAFPPLIKEALLCYARKVGQCPIVPTLLFPFFPADGKEKKVFKQSASSPFGPAPPFSSSQLPSFFSFLRLSVGEEGEVETASVCLFVRTLSLSFYTLLLPSVRDFLRRRRMRQIGRGRGKRDLSPSLSSLSGAVRGRGKKALVPFPRYFSPPLYCTAVHFPYSPTLHHARYAEHCVQQTPSDVRRPRDRYIDFLPLFSISRETKKRTSFPQRSGGVPGAKSQEALRRKRNLPSSLMGRDTLAGEEGQMGHNRYVFVFSPLLPPNC